MRQSASCDYFNTVLALITKLDGANVQLFHMEHCDNRKWQYQVRCPDSHVETYRDWTNLRAIKGQSSLVPMLDPNVIPEVRWKWESEEDWQTAIPHEWQSITCQFHVIVKQPRDFTKDPSVLAAGLVRGHPVTYDLKMPLRLVAQDGQEILTVTGTAIAPGPASILSDSAALVSASDAFSISSVGASQVTLLPVPPDRPRSLPFMGCIAIKVGKLSPEEIELLREYAAGLES